MHGVIRAQARQRDTGAEKLVSQTDTLCGLLALSNDERRQALNAARRVATVTRPLMTEGVLPVPRTESLYDDSRLYGQVLHRFMEERAPRLTRQFFNGINERCSRISRTRTSHEGIGDAWRSQERMKILFIPYRTVVSCTPVQNLTAHQKKSGGGFPLGCIEHMFAYCLDPSLFGRNAVIAVGDRIDWNGSGGADYVPTFLPRNGAMILGGIRPSDTPSYSYRYLVGHNYPNSK